MYKFIFLSCISCLLLHCSGENGETFDTQEESDITNDENDVSESDVIEENMEIENDYLEVQDDILDDENDGFDLLSEIDHYCIVAMSCIKGYSPSIGSCIWTIERNVAYGRRTFDSEVFDCMLDAGNNCDQIQLCIYHGGIEPASCEESSFEHRCEDNIAINCLGNIIISDDCSSFFDLPDYYEFTCQSSESEAYCSGETCEGFESRCNGDYLETCNVDPFEGLFARDCKLSFPTSTCEEISADEATCIGTGSACVEGEYDPWCNENTLTICYEGKEASFDCSIIGPNYTCLEDEAGAECGGLGDECSLRNPDTYRYTDSCDGTIISYCNAGYIKSVDCVSLGFSGCISYETGKSVCE